MANLTSIGTILLNDPTFVKNLNKALVQTNANFQRLGTIGLFSGEDGQDASFMKYNLDAIFLPIFIETLSDDNKLKLGWDKDICGDTKNTKIYTQLFKKFGKNIASIMPMSDDIAKDITARYNQAYKDMTEWCKTYGKPSEYIDKCQEIIEALDTAIRNKYTTSNVLNDVIYNDTEKSSTISTSDDTSKDAITRYDHAYNDAIKMRKAYVSPTESIDKYRTTIDVLDDFTINSKYKVLNDAIYNDTKNSSIAYKTLWVDSWYKAVKIDDCSNIYRIHVKDYPLGIIQVIENESGSIIGSLPYSFIDPRFNNAHVSQIADELKSKINATSLITLHQENNALVGKILDIIPKIYCDPTDGKWKWSINGENTGIPAQGVDGKAGQNGSILILQRLENGITISKGTKNVFIPIIPNSYKGNVEPTDESVKTITFKWLDPLVDDNAMVNRQVHTATITDDGRITAEDPNPQNVANDSKVKTLAWYMSTYSDGFKGNIIPKETVTAIRYALWDNVNRSDNYDANYTGRFRIWKRLTDDSCLYVAGDEKGAFNENAADAYSPETGYKYGYKVKEGTTDPGQAEITNMDGLACIVFPGAPYDGDLYNYDGGAAGEVRSSFWFGTVHIQRAYPKNKNATCNIATVICDKTNMVRCDLDQNTFAGDMMRLDPYITEEPDRYGGAHHYPRGLMLPIGSPFMTNENLSALSKDFSSHILYSDQGGFKTLTEKPGSIWRGDFGSIGTWQALKDIQGYKQSDKNILHIGSVQDYRGLDYVSTDNIAVPGRIEGGANNNQITPDNGNADVRSDHNFKSRVNIDEPIVLTSYRDTHNPKYAPTEYPALLTAEGDVVIGAYKHVNNTQYFWSTDDNGNTKDYAATNPQNKPTGDYANPNPDSHLTEDVINIANEGGRGPLGQGGLWIQGSITKSLADRMRDNFFEKSPMRSVIGTTFDIIPMGIGILDVKNADGKYIRILTPDPDETIHTGAKRVVDMIGSSTNVRFSLYADHAIGAQDIVAERSIAVYKQGTYYNIDNNYNITGEAIPYVGKKAYPMFYVGQGGIYINAEDIYFSENTCIDFADWRYYDNKHIRAWEMQPSDGSKSSPRLIFGWGIINSGSSHSTNQTYETCDNDISPEPFNITGSDSVPSVATMADGTFAIRHRDVRTLYTPKKNVANRVTFYQGPADYENYDDKSFSAQLAFRTPTPEKGGNRGYTFNGAMGCITDVQNVNTFTTNHLEFGLTAMWPTADFVMWDSQEDILNRHFDSARGKNYSLRASGIFHSGLLVDGYLYDTNMDKNGHYWLGQPYEFAFMVRGNSQMAGDLDVSNVVAATNIAKYSKTKDKKGDIRYDNSILLGGGKATVSGPKWRKLTITDGNDKGPKYVYSTEDNNNVHPDDRELELELSESDFKKLGTLKDPTDTDKTRSSDTGTQTPIMLDLGDSFGAKRLVRFNLAKKVEIDENDGSLKIEPIKDDDDDDSAVLLGRWPGSGWQSNITSGDPNECKWRALMTGQFITSAPPQYNPLGGNPWESRKSFNPTLAVAFWNNTSCHVEIHIKTDYEVDIYAGLYVYSSVSNKDSKRCAGNIKSIDTKITLPKGCPLPICPQTYSVAGIRRSPDGSGGSYRDKYKHGDAGIQFSLGTDGTLRIDSCRYPYMLYGGDKFNVGKNMCRNSDATPNKNDWKDKDKMLNPANPADLEVVKKRQYIYTDTSETIDDYRPGLYNYLANYKISSYDDLKDQTNFWQELVLTFDYPVITSGTSEGNTTGGSTGENPNPGTGENPNPGTGEDMHTYYIFGTIDGSYIQNGSIRNPDQNDTPLQITIPSTITVSGNSYDTILSAELSDNESESEGGKLLDAIADDNFKSVHQYIVMTTVTAKVKPSLQSLTFGVTSQTDDEQNTTYSWNPTANGHDDINFPALIQDIDTSDYVVMYPDPARSTQAINGSLTVNENLHAKAFYEDSDRRLKDNIKDIDKDTKQKLSNIDFKQFDINGSHRYGVIAQDIEKQIPAVVSTDKQGYKSVDYISLLCAKISELQDRIEELEKERKKD